MIILVYVTIKCLSISLSVPLISYCGHSGIGLLLLNFTLRASERELRRIQRDRHEVNSTHMVPMG